MEMDSAQIRHHNFMKLFNDFIHDHPGESQRGMLKMFAVRLELSDRYLSHIKCGRKNIGSTVARTIEERLELPRGWMDRQHGPGPVEPSSDPKEKLFIETALILYRTQPLEARDLMLNLLRERLHDPA